MDERTTNADDFGLDYIFNVISEGKWLIITITLLGALISFLLANGQTPTYRADALLRVESDKKKIPGLEELLAATDSSVETELIILKSRKNLGLAVKNLELDISAKPKRVPMFGIFYKNIFATRDIERFPSISDKFDKYSHKFAWSNESINIDEFQVPREFIDKTLTLRLMDTDGGFSVFTPENELLFDGNVNKISKSKDSKFSMFVSNLTGLPDTEFSIAKLSDNYVVDSLDKRIIAKEVGRKNNTGIISLSLEGKNKEIIVEILTRVTETYLSQNKLRSSEEASKALDFLTEQIKPIKKKSIEAENKLRSHRTRNQTTNMSLETRAILDVTSSIDTDLQQLSLKKDELSQKYTANHPSIVAISNQQAKLRQRKQRNLSRIAKLPDTQQTLLKLERNFKVANSVYSDLLNKIQEFKIAKASDSLGNVFVVDYPQASLKPVKPNKSIIYVLGTVLSGLLGMLLVFFRKSMGVVLIGNHDVLEKNTGIPVHASIPNSKNVKSTMGYGGSAKKQKELFAYNKKPEPTLKALRCLRSNMFFSLQKAKNNIVMFVGISSSTGASFLASNLSVLIAAGDKKVLLIDADMSEGYLHELLKVEESPGLSEIVISNQIPEEAIHSLEVGYGKLDFITRGETPVSQSELLMHGNFNKVLENLSSQYDLIILDVPPTDIMSDASIVGDHAGLVYIVVGASQHSLGEIKDSVKSMTLAGVEVTGLIFNKSDYDQVWCTNAT